jgi:hypothetical protein
MYHTPLTSRILSFASQTVRNTSSRASPAPRKVVKPGAAAWTPNNQLEDDVRAYLYRTTGSRDRRTRRQTPSPNMAFLLPGLRRGLLLSTPLILSAPMLIQAHRRPLLCDGPDPLTKITSDLKNRYASEAQTPVIKQSGAANPRAVRQISMGSIFGVLAGLGVSVFSKPLAILIGLGIVCLQVRMRVRR